MALIISYIQTKPGKCVVVAFIILSLTRKLRIEENQSDSNSCKISLKSLLEFVSMSIYWKESSVMHRFY